MGKFYQFIGSLLFRRQQEWQRQRNGRIMLWTVVVALTLGLAIGAVIKLQDGTQF